MSSDDKAIRLLFVGDYAPMRTSLKTSAGDLFVDERLRNILKSSDLNVVNLEAPVTSEQNRIKKTGVHYSLDDEALDVLHEMSVDCVVLANNHIRDFGSQGVKDTLKALQKRNILYVGAGNDLSEASKILYRKIKGKTIALINMTEIEFSSATDKAAGANPFDLIGALRVIDEAKENAEYVIFILHGGLEYEHVPSPESVKTLRFIAEQGVTAVIRHHPHYVQGVELWKGVPIAYSLGNFVCPVSNWNPEGQREGMLFELRVDGKRKCEYSVYGIHVEGKLPVRCMNDEEQALFYKKIIEYTKTVQDEYLLNKEWQRIVQERSDYYIRNLLLPNILFVKLFRLLGLLKILRISFAKRRLLNNWIQCDAHRELFSSVINEDTKTADMD